ncbi:hypothetical protein WH47_08984, partial [Habropoda laboriosa]
YLQPRYMETPEKRRKSKNAANTQHPQRYCPPSFLVNRISLSDDRIELGVPARLNLLVLTVLTEICNGKNHRFLALRPCKLRRNRTALLRNDISGSEKRCESFVPLLQARKGKHYRGFSTSHDSRNGTDRSLIRENIRRFYGGQRRLGHVSAQLRALRRLATRRIRKGERL